METPDHGLRKEDSSSPAASDSILRPKTATPSPHDSSSPPSRHGTPVPDQNSNSVRDLETAMSKHLPKQEPNTSSTASTNHLLRQYYSSKATLEAVTSEPVLRGGYSLSPAQPVPLKPSLYLDQYSDQSSVYTPAAGHSSSFHPYSRGQTWYQNN